MEYFPKLTYIAKKGKLSFYLFIFFPPCGISAFVLFGLITDVAKRREHLLVHLVKVHHSLQVRC